MSAMEKIYSPPNSIIFIADPSTQYELPKDMGGALVTASDTCIAVGTLAEMDGETTIRLGENIAPSGEPIFIGQIATPGLVIGVIDSGAETQLLMKVFSPITQVRIFANHMSEPDLILIEVVGGTGYSF